MGSQKLSVRLLLVSVVLAITLALGACGGGSDSGGGTASQGQVIKGLVAGSRVSVYTISVSGQRSLIANVLTDNFGAFSLPPGLKFSTGGVYLLEAVGGSYVNEITGASEPLTSPLRAVFVADQPSANVSISAISEMVALEIERSPQVDRWTPASVVSAEAHVRALFDISSSIRIRYIDLAKLSAERLADLTEDEFAFSFQLGMFAGYLEAAKRRNSAGLNSAIRTFFESMSDYSGLAQNDVQAAGLVRYIESLPFADSSFKAAVYSAYGLPSNASLSAFEGAEASGNAQEPVPNFKLRYLSPPSIVSSPTNDTVFDARGALVAYRLGAPDSGLGFAHVGSASVADVYGTSETAIGRWNRGYSYSLGARLNETRSGFEFPSQARLEELGRDVVYAAGAPAELLPTCGETTLSVRAQTSNLVAFDGSLKLRLAPSSKMRYRFTSSGVYVGYDFLFLDEQGRSHRMSSAGDGDPLQGSFLRGSEREVRFGSSLELASGERISSTILIAGDRAKKGVVVIESNIKSLRGRGIAAAFEQDDTAVVCAPVQLTAGAVSPNPSRGDYFFGLSFVQDLDFFDNGTPKFPSMPGLTASSGYSKSGNDFAGIGLIASSFVAGTSNPRDLSAYGYKKWSILPPLMPKSGSASYRLISSTPIVGSFMPMAFSGQWELLEIGAPAASATLAIYFNGEPVSPPSPYYGVCHLTIDGGPVLAAGYFQDDGNCYMNSSGIQYSGEEYSGGITANDNRYAVIVYTRYRSFTVRYQVALLFEKVLN